jgi:steroid delta-isomerase-like uncharacterized protein
MTQTTQSASTEILKPEELTERLIEYLDAHDLDGAEKYWDDDICEEFVALDKVYRGKREVRSFFEETFAAFPDFRIETERIVGDDHVAFVSWRSTGTFSGGSFQGIEPNGKQVNLRGCDRMEFSNGKLVSNTIYYDSMSFARQIGMMPALDSLAENAMKGAFNAVSNVKNLLGG